MIIREELLRRIIKESIKKVLFETKQTTRWKEVKCFHPEGKKCQMVLITNVEVLFKNASKTSTVLYWMREYIIVNMECQNTEVV